MSNLTPDVGDTGLPTLPRLPGSPSLEVPAAPPAATPLAAPPSSSSSSSSPPPPPPAATANLEPGPSLVAPSLPSELISPQAGQPPQANLAPTLPTTRAEPIAAVASIATPLGLGHGAAGATPRATKPRRRKWPKRLVLLTFVIGLAIVGATFGEGFYDQYQESRAASAAETSAAPPIARTPEGTPVGGVIDDARSVVDDININNGRTEILGQMGLDPSGNILPSDARSYRLTRDFGNGTVTELSFDAPTKNWMYSTSADENELRSMDGRSYYQPAASEDWIEYTPTGGLDHLQIYATDVVASEAVLRFAVDSTPTVHGGGRFVIDTAAFAAGNAEYWTSWTLFFTDGERVPVSGETATLDVVGLADGVLESATVTFLPSGDTMSYTLNDWSAAPLVITLD